jgi:hypothetical protein
MPPLGAVALQREDATGRSDTPNRRFMRTTCRKKIGNHRQIQLKPTALSRQIRDETPHPPGTNRPLRGTMQKRCLGHA